MSRRVASATLLLLLLTACRQGGYDIDRLSDPVQKARFSCQYLLERGLASAGEVDPDGVLRRRIADFGEPVVEREQNRVRVRWPAGAIVLRRDRSRHAGGCAITLRPQGRFIDAVDLDGAPLHAGFGM